MPKNPKANGSNATNARPRRPKRSDEQINDFLSGAPIDELGLSDWDEAGQYGNYDHDIPRR